jgi:hypothetical protein
MATSTDPAPGAEQSAGPVHELPLETAGVYEYVDTTERTYLFPGFAPQGAAYGDVCALPYDPGDGRWKPSKKKVTRLDDPGVEDERRRLEALAAQTAASPASPTDAGGPAEQGAQPGKADA